MVGGVRYVVSSGNQEQTKSAKNTIVYAVVGLVIIAAAQVIVQFVLNKSSKATGSTKSVAPTISLSSKATTYHQATHQLP